MNNYVKISITGRNPKLFLKRYFYNKIKYSNYKEINHKQIMLKINYEDYLLIKEKNSIYEISVIKLYGPIRYKELIKNKFTFFIALLISIIYLVFISNLIFDVQIVHNDKEIRSLIKDNLKENDISKYRFIPNFANRKKIIDKIIKDNKDKIEWLEIERTGSKLTVKVTERKLNEEKESDEPRHIIAKKSGILMKIEAENGVILKKKNDYVTAGEIVISGDVIKDETVKGQVHAKGKIYAETWYLVNVEYPLNYSEIIYLNDIKNNIVINFMDKEFSLRKNYASVYLEKKNMLIKSKVFPFNIRLEKQRKTKVKSQKYSVKQATKKAEELAEKKIKKKLNSDEYIISKKTLNFSSNDSKIEVDVFFKVCEDITDYKDVDKSLLNKEPVENES